MTVASFGLLASFGCQRGGDPQPTASLPGPSAAKSALPAADLAAVIPQKSDHDPFHPVVQIDTTLGSFTVRLDADKAPITVDNFLNYVAMHYYDQTIFHQVFKEYPKIIMGVAIPPT